MDGYVVGWMNGRMDEQSLLISLSFNVNTHFVSDKRTYMYIYTSVISIRITDIENTLLAYYRDTELSKQLGWFHEVVQGTLYSAAYLGVDHDDV